MSFLGKNTKKAPQLVIYTILIIYIKSCFQIVLIKITSRKTSSAYICVAKCISISCFYLKQNSKDDTATIYNEDGRFQYNISDVSTKILESESGGFFFLAIWR